MRTGIGVPAIMWAVRALNSCIPGLAHRTEAGRERADLAEVQRLHSLGAKSRTDRRRGTGLSRTDDELDDLVPLDRFLCH